jgi:histidine triad (HIT) family protein
MENCIFCQIAQHSLSTEIVFEDESAVVIRDRNPLAPVHLLVIPKEHYASLNEIPGQEPEFLGNLLFLARKMAFEQGIGATGYRVVINTGRDGGQSVYHLHIHVLGGSRVGIDLMTKGL